MSSSNDANNLDTQAGNIEGLHFPSLEEILQTQRPAPEPPLAETLPLEEQEALLYSVDDALKRANEGDSAAFEGMLDALSKLWHCQSQFLLRATEALANGSRNRQYIQPATMPVAYLLTVCSFASSCVRPDGSSGFLPPAYIFKRDCGE
jgi:hypothetical protein